jgi:DNA invertase Pin-like site-specific DNA recombinase
MENETLKQQKICALYARSAQSDPARIQSQLEACRAAVTKYGWKVDENYVHSDDGVSGIGGIADRPGLGALLAAAVGGNHPFDCLFIKSLDRLSRSITAAKKIITSLAQWGVTVHVVDPPFDTSKNSALFVLNILDAIQEVSRTTKWQGRR